MKKIISLLLLVGVAGCEVRTVTPHTTFVVESEVCDIDSADLNWATYCEGSCCYQQYHDSGWLCEEAWCYDYYYCGWEYMGDVCY